jgi:hypothetical protein
MFGGLRQILDAEPEMKDVHREGIQINLRIHSRFYLIVFKVIATNKKIH